MENTINLFKVTNIPYSLKNILMFRIHSFYYGTN